MIKCTKKSLAEKKGHLGDNHSGILHGTVKIYHCTSKDDSIQIQIGVNGKIILKQI